MRMMPKLTGRPVDADQGTAGALRPIIGRLSDEFVGLSHNTVERCVVDVRTRADHLGLAITRQPRSNG
jgi:hypothetical protein